MREERRLIRQEQIEQAAYALLEEKGFAGTTMQGIALRARASNQTLYAWYGDKPGLFRTLVARNADQLRDLLQARIAANGDPVETLEQFGPLLIEVLTHPRAVALNRAAAADPSGALGRLIGEAGRGSIGPLIQQVLLAARDNGDLHFCDPQAALVLYVDLLIGDLQIRRVIGLIAAPDASARHTRAARALTLLRQLLGGSAPAA
ncbi:TetR/AcrR family transcriptional regulator [Paracoccus sp. M683]|uniref:TetR/AcrR family transcriptional regulator n=1 Tax=Paracoccus sp. M683 TaxID=2594268 RepID=UPI00117E41B0|nr:TetR/AcrR family transcriptional regulator [Paracoccus sp. M683]TRW97325.1 TetR/AcrR family transcriptional regulator [Paracoccus sp. M683]